MHDVLKRARVAAVREREHPVADGGDPLHDGEQIDAHAQQARLFPLDADAHDRRADDLAGVVKGAEPVPQRQRRRVGGTQVADRLRHPVVARIGQRRERHRRGVGKKADDPEQSQLLNK